MRYLWMSNSPFVSSGYGIQTAVATANLNAMGHNVAIFAFYGLEGNKVDWGVIPIYPNNPRDWGKEHSPMFYKDFEADLMFTLVDAWVLKGLDPMMKWVPWVPIDHDPVPPAVVDALKSSPGLVKPMAMTKFGQKQLENCGIESYYVPHTVDCDAYRPMLEIREETRKTYGWEDKFVIGTIATNHSERKNWVAMMKAVSKFTKHHKDVVWYCHTNPLDPRGINIVSLRDELNLQPFTVFPSLVQLNTGIDRDAMVRAFNTMDVFLLASKGEGFGIPYIEAQACGVPVIMTDCTGHKELFGGGWKIKDLIPVWTGQNSWQFESKVEEIVECLEKAYKAKKDGRILKQKELAREKALEYDEKKIFAEIWTPMLQDLEERIKAPKNMEGVQAWRRVLIPQTCVPRKVLDIGCGLEQSYKELLEPLGEYVGLDIRGGNGNVVGDAHDLPFKDGEFGFVWCSEMLEHAEDPAKVVAEAKRVGKHGCIIFSTPQTPSFRIDPDHKIVKGVEYISLASGDGCISW